MTDKMEEEFEAWVMSQVENGHFYGGYTEGEYDLAWSAWKASREFLEIDLPAVMEMEYYGGVMDSEDVMDAIQSVGLKLKP